jgi:hypothetical protein
MHAFFPAGYVVNSLGLLVYLTPPKSSIHMLGMKALAYTANVVAKRNSSTSSSLRLREILLIPNIESHPSN